MVLLGRPCRTHKLRCRIESCARPRLEQPRRLRRIKRAWKVPEVYVSGLAARSGLQTGSGGRRDTYAKHASNPACGTAAGDEVGIPGVCVFARLRRRLAWLSSRGRSLSETPILRAVHGKARSSISPFWARTKALMALIWTRLRLRLRPQSRPARSGGSRRHLESLRKSEQERRKIVEIRAGQIPADRASGRPWTTAYSTCYEMARARARAPARGTRNPTGLFFGFLKSISGGPPGLAAQRGVRVPPPGRGAVPAPPPQAPVAVCAARAVRPIRSYRSFQRNTLASAACPNFGLRHVGVTPSPVKLPARSQLSYLAVETSRRVECSEKAIACAREILHPPPPPPGHSSL